MAIANVAPATLIDTFETRLGAADLPTGVSTALLTQLARAGSFLGSPNKAGAVRALTTFVTQAGAFATAQVISADGVGDRLGFTSAAAAVPGQAGRGHGRKLARARFVCALPQRANTLSRCQAMRLAGTSVVFATTHPGREELRDGPYSLA